MMTHIENSKYLADIKRDVFVSILLIVLAFFSVFMFFNNMSSEWYIAQEVSKLGDIGQEKREMFETNLRELYYVIPFLEAMEFSMQLLMSVTILSFYLKFVLQFIKDIKLSTIFLLCSTSFIPYIFYFLVVLLVSIEMSGSDVPVTFLNFSKAGTTLGYFGWQNILPTFIAKLDLVHLAIVALLTKKLTLILGSKIGNSLVICVTPFVFYYLVISFT